MTQRRLESSKPVSHPLETQKAEVIFSPRSARDMYKMRGMKLPACILRKNRMVPMTDREKQQDTTEKQMINISMDLTLISEKLCSQH